MGTEQVKETLEQFTERISHVEKDKELQVGRAYQGNTRAIFNFEGQWCHLESWGYRTLPPNMGQPYTPAQMYYVATAKPTDRWMHCKLIYTKKRAELIRKHYGADHIEEDPYPREPGVWFYLIFREFEHLMRMVYDIHTGKFKELWGENEKRYENIWGHGEGDDEVKDPAICAEQPAGG